MHALKPEDNACIACPASAACLSFARPFENSRFLKVGITGCAQYYCPECYDPWVVHSLNYKDARILEHMRAPLVRRPRDFHSSVLCEECDDITVWRHQVHNYEQLINERLRMAARVGIYPVTSDACSTTNDALAVKSCLDTSSIGGCDNNNEYLVRGDIANCIAEKDVPLAALRSKHETAFMKLRELKKLQKARKRANRDRYWGGRKP